jgi:hypothetical protein
MSGAPLRRQEKRMNGLHEGHRAIMLGRAIARKARE